MNVWRTAWHAWPLAALACLSLTGCNPLARKQAEYDRQEKALALRDQGKAQEKEGNVLLALEKYDRAARLYQSPAAYFDMGRVFEGQGKMQEAAAAYQQALKLSPDYLEARYALLAIGYTPDGKQPAPQELASAQAWAVAHAGEIPMSREAAPTTDTAVTTGTDEEREQLLAEAAQRRQPTQAEVRTVLFSGGKNAEPLPSATNPAYPGNLDVVLGTYPYHYRKAQQLDRRQMYEQAAIEYERAMQADPKQIDAALALGDMMLKTGRMPRARYHYETAMQKFPNSPRPYLKLGNYFLQLNRPDDARANYRKAIEKDANFVEAYNNLGVMALKGKNYPEAANYFDEIIKLDPSYANAYLNRGIIASDVQKDKARALECFKRYVELQGPRTPQVQRWIDDLQSPER